MHLGGIVGYGARNIVEIAWKAKENRIMSIPGAYVGQIEGAIVG
jgi:hypothetical protein